MDRYILNIGLLESATVPDGHVIRIEDALEAVKHATWELFDWDASVGAHAVRESDTEPTLVVEILTKRPDSGRVRLLADVLCTRLRREAIAVAMLSDLPGLLLWGDLRGPMAERWGGFNKKYFLMLDDRRDF